MNPNEYEDLFQKSSLNQIYDSQIVNAVGSILFSQPRYEEVQKFTKIPWIVIAVIHYRECGLKFDRHLHNGDPLTARTVHVPENRPAIGEPPFSWANSAIDALSEVWTPEVWSLGVALEFLERYNGLGYQKHDVYTPYVWAGTTAYRKGLFVADGTFDPEKISKQIGCAALFKWFIQIGHKLDFTV